MNDDQYALRQALMSLAAVPGFARMSANRLTPDSVIVVEFREDISYEQAQFIRKQLERIFPQNKSVVLSNGGKLTIVDNEEHVDE